MVKDEARGQPERSSGLVRVPWYYGAKPGIRPGFASSSVFILLPALPADGCSATSASLHDEGRRTYAETDKRRGRPDQSYAYTSVAGQRLVRWTTQTDEWRRVERARSAIHILRKNALSLHLAKRRALGPEHEADRLEGHVDRRHVLALFDVAEVHVHRPAVALLQRDRDRQPRQLARLAAGGGGKRARGWASARAIASERDGR